MLLRIGGERQAALEDVLELAHVAGKRIALERRDGFGIELRRIAARELREDRVGDQRNVLAHLAQARHRELDHVQPVVEVLPELAGFDERARASCAWR